MKKTVAIIGIGLIGGSLGQALRRNRRYRVIGVARRARVLRDALRRGAVDSGSRDLRTVSAADIVVIATPVGEIARMARKIHPYLRRGAVVTDVGSVKGSVLSAIGRSVPFVGSHPLAGSHRTGIRAARPDLFKNSTCVVVPSRSVSSEAIVRMWKDAGAKVQSLPARVHDERVALISHLPHVVAHAMVQSVLSSKDRAALIPLLAGSFRDATRVASSDPDQWAQIFSGNQPALRRALAAFRKQLSVIERQLGRPSLRRHLQRAHRFRLPLFQTASSAR